MVFCIDIEYFLVFTLSGACALLSPDSLRTFPGSSPEEQVRIWFRHHQHAHGVWQSWAKDEGVNDFSFVKELICFSSMYSSSSLCLCHLEDLMERLDSLLCGDGSESLKSLCLKLLLCLVTVRQNISKARRVTMWQASRNACCDVVPVFTGNRQY